LKDGKVLVRADHRKCIACGACIPVCHHGSRAFEDDTARFFDDLRSGVAISLITAPSFKQSFDNWDKILGWFRSLHIGAIYDGQLGADIYLWAQIRHLQRNGPVPMILNPCPAIVSYILMHKSQLRKFLSPVHSPMGCTAVYMRKYENVKTKIATLSPCIAKTHEYDDTKLVNYNITFKGLVDYMAENRIQMTGEVGAFDGLGTEFGSVFPATGGLKESLEYYLGKEYSIITSEGQTKAYKDLENYANKSEEKLPVFFNVMNCPDGCNKGIGCKPDSRSVFEISHAIHESRTRALQEESGRLLDDIFTNFDNNLQPQVFYRRFSSKPAKRIKVTPEQVEQAFIALNKPDDTLRHFDCGACGCNTCLEMARKIAKNIDTPINCLQKVLDDSRNSTASNSSYIDSILESIELIKSTSSGIVSGIDDINELFDIYNKLITEIEKISLSVNMISLNAAIEAAGADVHKGAFSVVADEIRKLAASSSDSAIKTRDQSAGVASTIRQINELVAEISVRINEAHENILTIQRKTKRD